MRDIFGIFDAIDTFSDWAYNPRYKRRTYRNIKRSLRGEAAWVRGEASWQLGGKRTRSENQLKKAMR